MKKVVSLSIGLVFFMITMALIIPCQADDLIACAKKVNGQLRIVSNASKCKKSEYPVTLNGTVNNGGTLKGEYCWDFVNLTKEYNGTVKLGFSHIGSNHHLCSGAVTVPPYGSFPVYGNAEIVEGKIYLTYSGAGQRNGIIGHDLAKVTLNPATLNGTFTAFGVYWDDDVNDGTAVVELTNEGTFTKTSCN